MFHESFIKGTLIDSDISLNITCPRCRKNHPNSKQKPHFYNVFSTPSIQPDYEFEYLYRCVDCNAVVEVTRIYPPVLIEPIEL